MKGTLRKAIVATALAVGVTGGTVAIAAPASANTITLTCVSQAMPPQVLGPATVRAFGQTSCGDPSSFALLYRPDVNSPWTNVTTSHSPSNGNYQYVYASPVRTGYFRATIQHSATRTTYGPEVYLVL